MADERTEKQKVQEITDKLEEGLKELFESEKYKTYLSTMSKFHNYSFNNTLLIAMQKPEATLVAGYKAWQKNFERHVNKGEKAIRILAPAPYKIREERDKLDPVTGEMMFDENGMPQKEQVEVTIPAFRAVSVFDVSQTDGKPIPELEAQELLSTVEEYEDFVQALMNVAPVPIGFEDIPGDSKGYFHTEEKRIAVQENMSESQTLKTMVHEVAHSMLHNKEINRDDLMEAPTKDRNMEVIAELVAKLPEMEIDGVMSEDMEAKVWEKRLPDLTPAEQLAVEIDRFSHDYDIYSYRNNNPNMTESVSEMVKYGVGDTATIMNDTSRGWLKSVVDDMCTYTTSSGSETETMANEYGFTQEQMDLLVDFMSPETLPFLDIIREAEAVIREYVLSLRQRYRRYLMTYRTGQPRVRVTLHYTELVIHTVRN